MRTKERGWGESESQAAADNLVCVFEKCASVFGNERKIVRLIKINGNKEKQDSCKL